MDATMNDRRALLRGGAMLLLGLASGAGHAAARPIPITVHRDANCGCCGAWVEHLKASRAFAPKVVIEPDMAPVKARLGVPDALASCHTAVVGGYVVEGHVPAADILRLLREKPKGVVGLSAPGMPPGSPGMEVPGATPPYAVLAFDRIGRPRLFARHGG